MRVCTGELDVLDRVGGGDGLASGLIYGLLSGESIEESLKLGWAHGALLTTTPGDTTMVTLEQVKAFTKGGSARIHCHAQWRLRTSPYHPGGCGVRSAGTARCCKCKNSLAR